MGHHLPTAEPGGGGHRRADERRSQSGGAEGSEDRQPVTGARLIDSKHAEVHVVFSGLRYPFPQEENLPVANKAGWQVCFGLLGPA